MKIMRKIIEIDEEKCTGCGQCVTACAEGAIEIIDGVAKVVADKYCDGLGACIGDCPEDALRIVERMAEDFDEAAVEALLKSRKEKSDSVSGGCPSARVQAFPMAGAPHSHGQDGCACASQPRKQTGSMPSRLGHWPVQIRLVPPGASFLKDADLVIAADCVPVAYPDFHADFLDGKAVMIGCPKFDNADEYVEKLSQIFAVSGVKSVTAVIMEVPCCSSLPAIIEKALDRAGIQMPVTRTVISARGEIVS